MSADEPLHRVTGFLAAFARRQAAESTAFPGGVAVRNPAFAGSHEHNQLVVDGGADPDGLAPVADRLLAGLGHRRITVLSEALGEAAAAPLTAAGYAHATELVMVHQGPRPARPRPPRRAEELDLDQLRPALAAQTRAWMPHADEETLRHLVDRRSARLRGADEVVFLGVRDAAGGASGGAADGGTDGAPGGAAGGSAGAVSGAAGEQAAPEVASWADFYRDPKAGVAQIEDLVTADAHVRRGHADAVLATALGRAAAADLVFLLADPDDWPRQWYARRGFEPVGRVHVFTRYRI